MAQKLTSYTVRNKRREKGENMGYSYFRLSLAAYFVPCTTFECIVNVKLTYIWLSLTAILFFQLFFLCTRCNNNGKNKKRKEEKKQKTISNKSSVIKKLQSPSSTDIVSNNTYRKIHYITREINRGVISTTDRRHTLHTFKQEKVKSQTTKKAFERLIYRKLKFVF